MAQSSEKQADLRLIKKINKGDEVAFMELVEKYETKVYHLAMRFTRNHEDAEEVLQDVFSTIHRKLHLFEGKSAFSSWLYRIVVNASFMKLRKRRQQPAVSLEDLSPTVRQQCLDGDAILNNQTDHHTLNRETRDILRDAINRLPDQYRDVFILRDVNGLSNQEVSEILQLSVPAVKSRLHRSRLMLRKKLQRYYAEFVGPRAFEIASEAAAALA